MGLDFVVILVDLFNYVLFKKKNYIIEVNYLFGCV